MWWLTAARVRSAHCSLARRRSTISPAVGSATDALSRLAQRDEDEEVLGALVERECHHGAVAGELVGMLDVGVGVLGREHEEADRTLRHRQRHASELERDGRGDSTRGHRQVLAAALRVVDDVGLVAAEVADQPVVLHRGDFPGQARHAVVGQDDVHRAVRRAAPEAQRLARPDVHDLRRRAAVWRGHLHEHGLHVPINQATATLVVNRCVFTSTQTIACVVTISPRDHTGRDAPRATLWQARAR